MKTHRDFLNELAVILGYKDFQDYCNNPTSLHHGTKDHKAFMHAEAQWLYDEYVKFREQTMEILAEQWG